MESLNKEESSGISEKTYPFETFFNSNFQKITFFASLWNNSSTRSLSQTNLKNEENSHQNENASKSSKDGHEEKGNDDDKKGDSLKIATLEELPEFIQEISELGFKEWPLECKTNGILSVEDYADSLRSYFNGGKLGYPFTLVAVDYKLGKLFGTVECIINDMHDRPQYSPWLASLMVVPEARGKGVASLLIEATKERASKCGIKTLYLWSKKSLESIYTKRGFTPVEERIFCGYEVVIQKIDLWKT